MRPRRPLLAIAVATLVLGPVLPALAAPETDFEMPFQCNEAWTGSTRSGHSPSVNSVDFNRDNDLGAPVVASAPGRVMTAVKTDNGSYGIWVQMDHGNNERTLYAHLHTVYVDVGQRVDQGQLIGLVGSSGNSTGPHMHYEQRNSSTVTAPYFNGTRFAFGSTVASRNCVDVPLAGDWNGDGKGQVTVFRRGSSAWFMKRDVGSPPLTARYGMGIDQPLAGDWDGDGTTNLGVRRAGNAVFFLHTPAGTQRFWFGKTSDQPIAGNWGGDARFEIGVWDPDLAEFQLRAENGAVTKIRLGNSDDLPVTGDWDGDGITDLGVYDQLTAAWTLRLVDRSGLEWTTRTGFGSPGDLPVVSDWNGDGLSDLGTWTPSTATFNQRRQSGVTRVPFGMAR